MPPPRGCRTPALPGPQEGRLPVGLGGQRKRPTGRRGLGLERIRPAGRRHYGESASTDPGGGTLRTLLSFERAPLVRGPNRAVSTAAGTMLGCFAKKRSSAGLSFVRRKLRPRLRPSHGWAPRCPPGGCPAGRSLPSVSRRPMLIRCLPWTGVSAPAPEVSRESAVRFVINPSGSLPKMTA